MCSYPSSSQRIISDMDLQNWFPSDCLSQNLHTVINKVILTPEPEVSPITYSSDSDIEWDASEAENEMSDMSADSTNVLMLEEGLNHWNNDPSTSMVTSSSVIVVTPGMEERAIVPIQGTSGSSEIIAGQLALPSAETSLAVALPDDIVAATTDGNYVLLWTCVVVKQNLMLDLQLT